MINSDSKEDSQVGTHGYVYGYRIGIDLEDCADEPEHRANAGKIQKFVSGIGERESFLLYLINPYITNVLVGFMSRKTKTAIAKVQVKYTLLTVSLRSYNICLTIAYERYFQSRPGSCVVMPITMVIIPKIHIRANTAKRTEYPVCDNISPEV